MSPILRMHTRKIFKRQVAMPLDADVSTDIAAPDGKDGLSMSSTETWEFSVDYPWIIRKRPIMNGEGVTKVEIVTRCRAHQATVALKG